MRVLNLSRRLRVKEYEQVFDLSHMPDIVIADKTTPKDYLNAISTDIPTVDYRFSSEKDLIEFLEEYSSKGIRRRLKDLYNSVYELKDDEVVPYVIYFGYSAYIYERIKTVLLHPLKPWIVIYGPVGSGKLALVKSILGDNYVEDKPEEINGVVINTSLLEGESEIKEIMDFLYSRGYQATFIVESKKIPQILKTIPSFYIPALIERPIKERLLILEHLLRNLSKIVKKDVEVDEDFIRVYFSYDWPKNFSELENAIRFALSINDGVLKAENLPEHIKGFSGIE
ncbi:MAG: hypothetical protein ABIL67_01505 [candidate division WOR-3 bacterium]